MFEFNATLIIAMISFVVFIMIMNAILYKPILSIINERKKYIDENNSAAKNSKEKAQNLLMEKDERLNNAAIEAKKIVSQKLQEETDKAKTLTDKAKADSLSNIDSAKQVLYNEELQTADALKTNIKDLAESISAKILGENIAIDNVDYELINKVLK